MSNYIMDYDWLTQVQLDDRVARIVVTVDDPDAYEAAEALLDSLGRDSRGVAGRGDWSISLAEADEGKPVIMEIYAGGEDVADAVQDATDATYEHFEVWGYADDLQWDSVTVER